MGGSPWLALVPLVFINSLHRTWFSFHSALRQIMNNHWRPLLWGSNSRSLTILGRGLTEG